jgi:hypothetical protein
MTVMLCYQLSSYVANFMCWPVWTLQVVTIECYSCQSSGLSTAHWVATQVFPSYWMKRTKNNEKSKRVGIYRYFRWLRCSWWLLIVRLRWSMRCDWRFLGSSRVSMLLRCCMLIARLRCSMRCNDANEDFWDLPACRCCSDAESVNRIRPNVAT